MNVIAFEVVEKIRTSTCAITEFPFPVPRADQIITSEYLRSDGEVHGTGFLINDQIVLTNRHIVDLIQDTADGKDPKRWRAVFQFIGDSGDCVHASVRIKQTVGVEDPEGQGRMDIGLVIIPKTKQLGPCKPVELGGLSSIVVGSHVGICGYPLGDALLEDTNVGLDRFGPVFQEGMVAAVSPYELPDVRNMTTFLTDIRAAGGSSGSPVFVPETGRVIGLHYAGATSIVGLALPLDAKRVRAWEVLYFDKIAGATKAGTIHTEVTKGGDIVGVVKE